MEVNKALNDHGYLALVIKIFSYKKKKTQKFIQRLQIWANIHKKSPLSKITCVINIDK